MNGASLALYDDVILQPLFVALVILAVSPAWGDDRAPAASSYGEHRHQPKSDLGVSVTAGAGVRRFTSDDMRTALTNEWSGVAEVRLTLGSRKRFGLEASTSASAARARSGDTDSTPLIGLDDELALRLNVLPRGDVAPYAFAGIGWQHFDIRNGVLGIDQDETSMVFPVGAGIAYRNPGGPLFDVRGTFRPAAFDNLIADTSLDSWTVSAAVGFER